MKKRGVAFGIALAFALLALLVGGVLLLRDDVAGPPAPPDRGGPTTGDAETKSGPDHPADEALAGSPDRAAAPDASRDVLADNPPPTEGPTVTFVESETGRPLPDAGVWLVLRSDVSEEEWTAFDRYDADADALMKERGLAIELDALATATLSFSRSDAVILALAGERHLCRPIELDHTDRLLMKLVRREKLTLLAIDPDGRRQSDVPLSLQTLLRGDPWKPPTSLRWRQSTDDQGETIVPQGSELLDEHLDADGLANVKVLVAALAFPCRDPSATLVDPRTACAEPVKLVTPPRSRLRLHAVEPDGSRIERPVIVHASIATATTGTAALPVQRQWTTTIRAGAASDMVVEADASIHLEACTVDGEFEMVPSTVLAPARADSSDVELVLVKRPSDVPMRPGWRSCSVLVREAGGAPLSTADVHWQVDAGDMPRAGQLQPGRTDAKGLLRFQCKRGDPTAGSKAQRQLDVFDGLETPLSRGAKRHGSTRFVERSRKEPLDVGTVDLLEVPVLVAGRAVDVRGRGLPDVDVEVKEWRRDPKVWTTRTTSDGTFSLRAESRASELEVWPSREHWYREDEYLGPNVRRPIRVPVQTHDADFTMHRNGFVRGRLLVDPGISRRDLSLGVYPDDVPVVSYRLDPDGRFLLEGAPCRRSIAVWSRPGSKEPFRQVDDVVLREGEETVDPRLDPIDLRGDLRQIELRVTAGDDGAPVAGASVYLTRNRGIVQAPRSTDPFGRALVTTATFDSALAVGSPDHLFRQIVFDRSYVEVRLAPAIRVRVQIEGDVERLLASPRFAPSLWLAKATGGELLQELWSEFPPPAPRRTGVRTIEFLATVEGTYSLGWMLQLLNDEWIQVRAATSVSVRAGSAVVDVVEKFSDEEVRRIAAPLRR